MLIEPKYVITKNSDQTPLCQDCEYLYKNSRVVPCGECKALVSTRPKNYYSKRGPQ